MVKTYELYFTQEYEKWVCSLTIKEQLQIAKRLLLIEEQGHFGDYKSVSNDNSIWELRWKNGRRLYYCHISDKAILLLIGGNKNGQSKNISEAKKLLAKNMQG